MLDLQIARASLLSRFAELKTRHDKVDAHLHHTAGALSSDSGEQALELENDQVLEGLDASTRAELGAILGAVQRIDAGNYGVCTTCEGQIGEGRLRAMPTTTQCIDCAGS